MLLFSATNDQCSKNPILLLVRILYEEIDFGFIEIVFETNKLNIIKCKISRRDTTKACAKYDERRHSGVRSSCLTRQLHFSFLMRRIFTRAYALSPFHSEFIFFEFIFPAQLIRTVAVAVCFFSLDLVND